MATRPTFPPNPHLRNACDACTSAKVKCSQGRPQCKRCEYRGFLCQYSVSLRATKNARRPSSVSTSGPRGFNSTVTSSNHDGQGTFDDASMNSPSVTSANRIFSHAYDQITPSFDDESVLSSFFEDWDPDTRNDNSQTHSPECNGDTMPFFPNLLSLPHGGSSPKAPQPISTSHQAVHPHSNNNNSKRSRSNNFVAKTTSSFPPDRASTTVPLPTPAPSTTAPSPTDPATNTILPQACQCQHLILSKLSEMSHRKADRTVPFDQCMSENKSAIALCNTAVKCSTTYHNDDLVFMLTSLALVTHVILFYDRPLGPQDEPVESPSEDGIHPAHPQRRFKSKRHHFQDHQEHQRPRPPQQQQQHQQKSRFRLSLGTYALDTRDEQILQNNLLRIELSKIKSLMEAFERRFYTLEWMSSSVLGTDAAGMAGDRSGAGTNERGDGEENPLSELLAWLKRRLRANYEALAHWGSIGI